jgi:hypothetical protein
MTFWLDDFEGKANGGYYIRNDLKEFFKTLEKIGKKPVGIKYDGSYNLEILTEVKDEEIITDDDGSLFD